MSILFRPGCWLMGHEWYWLVQGHTLRCFECGTIKRVR